MEHLDGETLEDLLKRRRVLPPGEAVRLAHQTLLGLQHIHEQGMVHRDIKPANLFLVSSGSAGSAESLSVKILDIGLARELFEETPQPGPMRGALDLTAEGVLLGTPDYLAPEQARDPRRSDIRADIYSTGCVLYHMLVGQPPFPDSNLFNQIVRHATEAPRPLRSFEPSIPEGLEQIVAWMMAKQPDQRYPTPARAAQALEVFLLMRQQPASAEEAPQMRKFLTWLELEDKPAAEPPAAVPIARPPSSSAVPVRPKSSPAVPVLATPAPAAPQPLVATPLTAQPLPAAAVPVAAQRATPQVLDIDVELVAIPPPSTALPPLTASIVEAPIRKTPRTKNNTTILVVAGIAALLVGCGCLGLVGWMIRQAFQ
jgi:serine/threonine protein kinase